MANIADQYPARQQKDGTWWFRPVRDSGMDVSQWAWTHDPTLAHPDYEVCEHGVPMYGYDCDICDPSGRDDPTSISNLMAAGPPSSHADDG